MSNNTENFTKINTKEFVDSRNFEAILEWVFFALEKINAQYYIKIMKKILDKKSINIVEYKNFVAILQDEEFQNKLEKYANSLDIDMILETFDLNNILALVKDKTTDSLVDTLEEEWEIGFRFSMRRDTGTDLKTANYIIWLDYDGNKEIYEILYEKNKEKLFICWIRNIDWKITKRGYLDIDGNPVYGGVKWFWVSPRLGEKEGKQVLPVRETKDGIIKMIDKKWKEI